MKEKERKRGYVRFQHFSSVGNTDFITVREKKKNPHMQLCASFSPLQMCLVLTQSSYMSSVIWIRLASNKTQRSCWSFPTFPHSHRLAEATICWEVTEDQNDLLLQREISNESYEIVAQKAVSCEWGKCGIIGKWDARGNGNWPWRLTTGWNQLRCRKFVATNLLYFIFFFGRKEMKISPNFVEECRMVSRNQNWTFGHIFKR